MGVSERPRSLQVSRGLEQYLPLDLHRTRPCLCRDQLAKRRRADAPTPGNSLDVIQIRNMHATRYTNIGGVESLWATHTVRRANTSGSAASRWYQIPVTGGTVGANDTQGVTWDPDAANTFYRFVPSLAVDRMGNMALGYSKSNSTTNPQISTPDGSRPTRSTPLARPNRPCSMARDRPAPAVVATVPVGATTRQ